eukprot:gene1544-2984_t
MQLENGDPESPIYGVHFMNIIDQEESAIHLLKIIRNEIIESKSIKDDFIKIFTSLQNFASHYNNWLVAQATPFVSLKGEIKYPMSSPSPSGLKVKSKITLTTTHSPASLHRISTNQDSLGQYSSNQQSINGSQSEELSKRSMSMSTPNRNTIDRSVDGLNETMPWLPTPLKSTLQRLGVKIEIIDISTDITPSDSQDTLLNNDTSIIHEFIHCDMLKTFNSKLIYKLNKIIESKQLEDSLKKDFLELNNIRKDSKVEYIRSFRDDIDDRNEYKSQVETAVYNERERCYDDFSNMFRQFQIANKGDIDGRRVEEFWQSLHTSGTKVLSIRDCNFPWFADIFKSMLLFYGLNTSETATSSSNSSSAISSTKKTSEINKTGSTTDKDKMNSQSHYPVPVSVPSTGPHSGQVLMSSSSLSTAATATATSTTTSTTVTTSNTINNNVNTKISNAKVSLNANTNANANANAKEMLLEARMGPGGKGRPVGMGVVGMGMGMGTRRPPIAVPSTSSSTSTSTKYQGKNRDHHMHVSQVTPGRGSSGSSSAAYNGIGSGGIGAGSTGSSSHRLKQLFSSFEAPSEYFPGNQQFFFRFIAVMDSFRFTSLLVAKLRILGRFLGFLQFWPQWSTLSVGRVDEGPLDVLAKENASRWKFFEDNLFLKEIIHHAYKKQELCLCIPWIAEFLKMMTWLPVIQSPSQTHTQSMSFHKDIHYLPFEFVLSLLRCIQTSSSFSLYSNKISGNRMQILLELQELFSVIPVHQISEESLYTSMKYLGDPLSSTVTNNNNINNSSSSSSINNNTIDEEDDQSQITQIPLDNQDTLLINWSPSTDVSPWPWLDDAITILKQRRRRVVTTTTSSSSNTHSHSHSSIVPTNVPFVSSSSLSSSRSGSHTSSNLNATKHAVTMSSSTSTSTILLLSSPIRSSSDEYNQNNCINSRDIINVNVNHHNIPGSLLFGNIFPSPSSSPGTAITPTTTTTTSRAIFSSPQRRSVSGSIATTTSGTSIIRGDGNGNGRSILGNNNTNSFETAMELSIQDRLCSSFWQQNSQLQSISLFVLEQLHSSIRTRLRLRAAETVLQGLQISDVVKSDLEILNSKTALCTDKDTDIDSGTNIDKVTTDKNSNSNNDNDNDKELNSEQNKCFQILEKEMNRLYSKTIEEIEIYLDDFLRNYSLESFKELCKLYPVHIRVAYLATLLTQKQALLQKEDHKLFFSKYLRGKLNDVIKTNTSQYEREEEFMERVLSSNELFSQLFSIDKNKDKDKNDYKDVDFFALLTTKTSSVQILNMILGFDKMKIDDNNSTTTPTSPFTATTATSTNYVDIKNVFNDSSNNDKNDDSSSKNIVRNDHQLHNKISVELIKLITIIAPALFSFDNYISWDIKNHYIKMNILNTLNFKFPSDILLVAEAFQLLNIHAIARGLLAASKPNSLSFFETHRGIKGIKTSQCHVILAFIARYLRSYNNNDNCLNNEYINNSSVQIDDSVEWYFDPAICGTIKVVISEDLSNLIRYLTKHVSKQE